jgi:lysophospholipase L1-like esterase
MTFSLAVWIVLAAPAQGPVPPVAGAQSVGETREWTAADDHRTMIEQPGIKALRPGWSGNEQAPNHANYDEALANPFPKTPEQPAQVVGPADQPAPRTDQNSMTAHAELVKKAKTGRIDVYFVGDSITRRWGALDYPELLANWRSNFFGWNAANFGWGADRIQNILWRLENGELDGVRPRIIVVLAGTNNVGTEPGGDEKITDITRGLKAIVDVCQRKAPNATIILTAIFPRNDNMAVLPEIDRINAYLASLADGRKIRFINVNDQLADKDGRLSDGMTRDKLHPTLKGYQIWADALKPVFLELLGPPAGTDLAPPPTGDPAARSLVKEKAETRARDAGC